MLEIKLAQEIILGIFNLEGEAMKNFSLGQDNSIFAALQNFGKALMLPIAILPAAGFLLGIGGALSNPNTLNAYPFLDKYWLQDIFLIMAGSGEIVFATLPILFAVSLAVGLSKTDKGTVGVAAVLSMLIMNATINACLKITQELAQDNLTSVGQGMCLGIQTLETGVFSGILIGIMTAWLHKKFYKTELLPFLAFFGGSRFVPMICALGAMCMGIEMYVIWPYFQEKIFSIGELFSATGYIGTLIYGFFLRMLGPFGLHHIFYLPFWTTALGGSEIVNGQLVEGTQRIFFAQLSDPNTVKYYEGISRFMSGRFITMMFGLVGAAFAIYKTAKPQNRKFVGGMLLSAALTSFLTGITEPLEFSFLFVAPMLYVLHAFFDGCAFMMAHIFQITIGQTFSGGLIDFILFGIMQGDAKTNWIYVPLIGVPWFFLYYFSFKYLIEKYNFKTPGRDEDLSLNPEKALSDAEQTQLIISGLGGRENIDSMDCCITRLRVTVKEALLVSEEILMSSGAKGVLQHGVGVQIIYGPQVAVIKNRLEEAMS